MKTDYEYDYSDLRARISEKFGTMTKFATAMGCTKGAISQKLTNRIEWSQSDILKASELLDIPTDQIASFFIKLKFRNPNSTDGTEL